MLSCFVFIMNFFRDGRNGKNFLGMESYLTPPVKYVVRSVQNHKKLLLEVNMLMIWPVLFCLHLAECTTLWFFNFLERRSYLKQSVLICFLLLWA